MPILKNCVEKTFAIGFLLLAGYCLSVEISHLDTGIDLTDEGWHVSKFRFPDAVSASVLRDHLYSSILFKVVDYDIKSLRAINLLFLVLSAFILSRGLYSWFKFKNYSKLQPSWVLQSILFSSMLLWQIPTTWIERVPAYNNLSSFLILTSVGAAMIASYGNKRGNWIWYTIGSLSGLALIVRPPSGIVLLLFIFAFVIIECPKNNFKTIFPRILLGFFTLFVFHFLFIESLGDFISTSVQGFAFEDSLANKHGLHTLERYFWEIFVNIKFAFGYNKFVLLFAFLATMILPQYVFWIIISGLALTSIHFGIIGDLNGGPSLGVFVWRYYFALAIQVLVCSLALYLKKGRSMNFINMSKKALCRIFLFILSPVFFALGTHAPLILIMNFYACFFFIAILFFTCNFIKTSTQNSIVQISFLLLALLIGSSHSFLNGRINNSFYSLNHLCSLPAYKNKTWALFGESRLMIGHKNKKVIDEIISVFTPDICNKLTYCINFTSPGYNYHIGVPHPKQPWTLFSKWNFTLLNLSHDDFANSAIIINDKDDRTKNQLHDYSPDWNSTHIIAGKTSWMYEQDEISLSIYLPISINE